METLLRHPKFAIKEINQDITFRRVQGILPQLDDGTAGEDPACFSSTGSVMTDLNTLSVHDQRSENGRRKAEIKGGESAPARTGKIPPLAEVILMHFAVAFPVSRGSGDDSVFSCINLVAAGERGGVAILA